MLWGIPPDRVVANKLYGNNQTLKRFFPYPADETVFQLQLHHPTNSIDEKRKRGNFERATDLCRRAPFDFVRAMTHQLKTICRKGPGDRRWVGWDIFFQAAQPLCQITFYRSTYNVYVHRPFHFGGFAFADLTYDSFKFGLVKNGLIL